VALRVPVGTGGLKMLQCRYSPFVEHTGTHISHVSDPITHCNKLLTFKRKPECIALSCPHRPVVRRRRMIVNIDIQSSTHAVHSSCCRLTAQPLLWLLAARFPQASDGHIYTCVGVLLSNKISMMPPVLRESLLRPQSTMNVFDCGITSLLLLVFSALALKGDRNVVVVKKWLVR